MAASLPLLPGVFETDLDLCHLLVVFHVVRFDAALSSAGGLRDGQTGRLHVVAELNGCFVGARRLWRLILDEVIVGCRLLLLLLFRRGD